MKSVRKSLLKSMAIRFVVVVFVLLFVNSVVWFFLLKDVLMLGKERDIFWILIDVGKFVGVLIVVLVVVALLVGLIFKEIISKRISELAESVKGLREGAFGSRVRISGDDEFVGVAEGVNEIIEGLESEIKKDLSQVAKEEEHFVEEKGLLEKEQKKIYEEKEKLSYVLSRIADGVILLSRKRDVVIINKAAEDLVGFKQGEAGGKSIASIVKFFEVDASEDVDSKSGENYVKGDDDPATVQTGQNATSSFEKGSGEASSVSGETREIMVDEYASKLGGDTGKDEVFMKKHVRMESGQATEKFVDLLCVKMVLIKEQDLGYMIVMHDLTPRMEVNKKRTELLSAFGRELKQPIGLISNYFAQFIKGHQDVMSDNSLARVQSGIIQLSLTLENLMVVEGMENGSLNANLENLDLAKAAGYVTGIVMPLAEEAGIVLQYQEPKDVATVVSGDVDRLHQIILNLLVNAINFTESGGSVTISFTKSGQEIILQIQDTGIGIKSEDAKNLYKKFNTIPNEKNIETGAGLGLYVCKRLVELQGGKIWIDSVEGRGTVVSVSLKKAG